MKLSVHIGLEEQKESKLSFTRGSLRSTTLRYDGNIFFASLSTLANKRYLAYSSCRASVKKRGKILPVFPMSSMKLVANVIYYKESKR